MALIERKQRLEQIDFEFQVHPICCLLGPRQCGKTTLAKTYAKKLKQIHLFDCEDSRDLAKLDHPMMALESLTGLVIIDEIQRRPELFPALRVLADQTKDRQFLLLGSASPALLNQSSETLAGRVGFQQITPFTLDEVGDWKKLFHRGGFPRSYLAASDKASQRWRGEYIRTFVERDLFQVFEHLQPAAIGRLWRMLAHVHGSILNYNEISRSLGVSSVTVQRYVDGLEQTFMVRRLKPWHENLSKREVKSPKVYIRDSGLFASLLGIETTLEGHVKVGAAFEGLAVEQIISRGNFRDSAYFWATHSGAELDLLIFHEGKRIGFEIKYTEHPGITNSMRTALEDLKLDHLFVVVPFETVFALDPQITCIGLSQLMAESNESERERSGKGRAILRELFST